MRHRTNETGEYVEIDVGKARWHECAAERAEMALRWRALAREMEDMLDRYENLCWAFKLRDVGLNGILGQQHAHGIWRLHRGIRNSAINLAAEIVK